MKGFSAVPPWFHNTFKDEWTLVNCYESKILYLQARQSVQTNKLIFMNNQDYILTNSTMER